MKLKNNLRDGISKMSIYDKYTIGLLMIGFISSIVNFDLLEFFAVIFSVFNIFWFLISYSILSLTLIVTVKSFIKKVESFRIKKEDSYFEYFKLFLVGYYLGFLVNVANAITLNMFDRLMVY